MPLSQAEEAETEGLLASTRSSSADVATSQASNSSRASDSSACSTDDSTGSGQVPGVLRIPVATATRAQSVGDKPKEPALLCRICLEDEVVSNLVSPCGCTGTQRYAHRTCIQRWIDEKGHMKCEICDQPYVGNFTTPPPQPAPQDIPLFASIRIDADERMDLLDDDMHYQQRHPAASWCITFVVFLLFLVVLHHTMIVADGLDTYSDGSGGSGADPDPPHPDTGGDTDPYGTNSLSFFLFWVATKAFLIGIPLYTVMRIASRQARREQIEALMRSGALDAHNRRWVFRVRPAGAGRQSQAGIAVV